MRKVPQKNYFIVILIIIFTILLTLFAVQIYNNSSKEESEFYKYSNKISGAEFNEYASERTDLIVYIADKYDLSNIIFEKQLLKKIDEFNLKDKLIYIDKRELVDDFLSTYGVTVNKNDLPIIIVMIDGQIIKFAKVNNYTDANTIIEYGVFE